MVAVQGYYEDGRVELTGKAPARRARILVIFQEDLPAKEASAADWESLREFGGSITRVIDEKADLIESLEEKYARID